MMHYSRLVKLNQGLLTGTALLGLLSIVTGGLAGSAAGLTSPVLGGFANFFAGMTGNNLGTLIERFRKSNDVLRNEDLAKAAGRTVAKALTEKISPNYSDKESLNHFAHEIEDYWVQWAEQAKNLNLFETLQEDQLYQIFSQQPEHLTEYQVLPEEEWREVVTWLFQQGCERGVLGDNLENYQDVIKDLAAELATNFNKHLRQVLKDDANNGSQAFVEMLFDLHGATLAKVEQIRDYLPQLATREDMLRVFAAIERLQGSSQPAPATPWHGLGAINTVIDTVKELPPNFLPNRNQSNFLREHQSLIERSIARSSKSTYQKTIELIDVYAGEDSLDQETRLSLILNKAILFQENGDITSACKAIKIYENSISTQKQRAAEYYKCKGKLISQISGDPARLSAYLDSISQRSLFKGEDGKKELASLYWRASVLWYGQDIQKADFYLSTHRDFINAESYQNAHNHYCVGFSNLIKQVKGGVSSQYLIDTSFEALTQSFTEYVGVKNFRWLNKCIASNLLTMALIDYLAKSPIKFYKKLFYVRKIFILHKIGYKDEAISEIIFVIKKFFPEVFEVLFSNNLSNFIRQHSLSEILREIYLEVESEFFDIESFQSIDAIALYKRLVS